MLKEILAISGKSGLYRLVSRGNNLLIVESLSDKKRTPAYTHNKVISLGDVTVYTEGEDTPISQIFTAIKEKENGGKVSIDLTNAQPDELRAYLAEVLPNFDRQRVYTSDIKKMLKWYEILIADGITEFAEKEEAAAEETAAEEKTEAPKATAKSAPKAKRKETTAASAKAATAIKTQATPKTTAPKKSLGAKRGG